VREGNGEAVYVPSLIRPTSLQLASRWLPSCVQFRLSLSLPRHCVHLSGRVNLALLGFFIGLPSFFAASRQLASNALPTSA
jgi:hypothetical protein